MRRAYSWEAKAGWAARAGWAAKALIVAICIAYQYAVYVAIRGDGPAGMHTVLLWAPLALLAAWALARSRRKAAWIAGLLVTGAIAWLAEHYGGLGLASVSGLSHAAIYLFLAGYFGRTLARGREPLLTRFARGIHGELPAPMEIFMRRLTVAWCVFCGGQVAVSVVLFAYAPLSAWSLFVNILNFPLVALMFLGQFAYRAIRHPDFPPASPWKVMKAFAQGSAVSNRVEMR
jgi:uncharacterized membrane protein